MTLTPVLIIPFMLFAGFFVSSDNIPVYLKEFEYLSIFKYGYQALMHNNFDYYQGQVDNYVAVMAEYGQASAEAAAALAECTWECWCIAQQTEMPNKEASCDPFVQLSDTSKADTSMWALFLIYGVCYLTAWAILTCLSSKYE